MQPESGFFYKVHAMTGSLKCVYKTFIIHQISVQLPIDNILNLLPGSSPVLTTGMDERKVW